MEPLLLLPAPEKRARPNLTRFAITVPAGFALPKGGTVRDPFNLTVEAGVRWHPEWSGPKVTVNAWRFLPMGDAIGFSGQKVGMLFASLLPNEVNLLTPHHGAEYNREGNIGQAVRDHLNVMGIDAPEKPEQVGSFIAKPVTTTRAN